MAAARPSPIASPNSNRRRRVRHKIQTPAYASFTGAPNGAMLELHEIVNISEDGVAIQCSSPIEADRTVNLCLDLAECNGQIFTTSQVIWANSNGLAGLRFAELSPVSLFRLREWLFLNVMAGASNADSSTLAASSAELRIPAVANYSDMLATANAVQHQVEALGTDLPAALQLISDRSQTLLRASGAALALATNDPDIMDCRASSGDVAPPIGTRLQVGSGFSGECVKSGQLLRCDDTELDSRVDRESCQALGIRSILAVPVRSGEKSIGIIETFSEQPNHFTDRDSKILQRFAETVLSAVNRAENLALQQPKPLKDNFGPRPGSVLFASEPEPAEKSNAEKNSGGISLPKSLLGLLIGAAILISIAMGYLSAGWLQTEVEPWVRTKLHAHASVQLPSVLASTHAPKPEPPPGVETATLDELKQMAANGDPAAQNALGLRYAQADGVPLDERQAANWFEKAAENGNVPAQSKLGAILLTGRGVPQNFSQAYFWIALARASGDEASKIRAPLATKNLTRDQVASIELDANRWLQQHSPSKPPAGH